MRIEAFLEKSLLFGIYRAYDQVYQPFRREVDRSGLKFVQALVLVSLALEEKGPVTPSRLARVFTTSRSNMTHCLTPLVKRGLILRSIVPEDARSFTLHITALGKRKAAELMVMFDRAQDRLEEVEGSEATEEISLRLSRICKALEPNPQAT